METGAVEQQEEQGKQEQHSPVRKARGRPKGSFKKNLGRPKSLSQTKPASNESAGLSGNPELASTTTTFFPKSFDHTKFNTTRRKFGRPKGSKNKILDPEVVRNIIASRRPGRVQHVNYNVKLAFKRLRKVEDSLQNETEVAGRGINGDDGRGELESVVRKGRGRPVGSKNKEKPAIAIGHIAQVGKKGRGRPRKGEEPWRRVVETTPIPSQSPSKKVLMRNSPIVKRSFGGFLGTPAKVIERGLSEDEEDEDDDLGMLIEKAVEEPVETKIPFALQPAVESAEPQEKCLITLPMEQAQELLENGVASILPKVVDQLAPEERASVVYRELEEPPTQSSLLTPQTTKEQTMPTNSLAKFSKLPKEIQGMIWAFALEGATPFTEVIFDRRKRHFKASGPSSDILAVCGPTMLVKGVEPIHLSSNVSPSDPSIIHLRPEEDILYIPQLDELDVIAFLARAEHQAIQKIGFPADLSPKLYHDANTDHPKPAFRLLMGLKNLKAMYFFDGEHLGDERRVDHTASYSIELIDLERSDERTTDLSAARLMSPSSSDTKPWDLEGLAIAVRDCCLHRGYIQYKQGRTFGLLDVKGKVIVRNRRAEISHPPAPVPVPLSSGPAASSPTTSAPAVFAPVIEQQPNPEHHRDDTPPWEGDLFNENFEWEYGATNDDGDVGYVF